MPGSGVGDDDVVAVPIGALDGDQPQALANVRGLLRNRTLVFDGWPRTHPEDLVGNRIDRDEARRLVHAASIEPQGGPSIETNDPFPTRPLGLAGRPAPLETGSTMEIVLLVEANPAERRWLGERLKDAGYALVDCPGPRREDFSCLGVRGQHCALVEIADVVILDGRVLQHGTDRKAATRLVHSYLTSGKPVLVLIDSGAAPPSFESDRVATADRSDPSTVLKAVGELLDSGSRVA